MALLKDYSTMIVVTIANVQPFNPCYQVGIKLWHATAVLACRGQRLQVACCASKNTDFDHSIHLHFLVMFLAHPVEHSDFPRIAVIPQPYVVG